MNVRDRQADGRHDCSVGPKKKGSDKKRLVDEAGSSMKQSRRAHRKLWIHVLRNTRWHMSACVHFFALECGTDQLHHPDLHSEPQNQQASGVNASVTRTVLCSWDVLDMPVTGCELYQWTVNATNFLELDMDDCHHHYFCLSLMHCGMISSSKLWSAEVLTLCHHAWTFLPHFYLLPLAFKTTYHDVLFYIYCSIFFLAFLPWLWFLLAVQQITSWRLTEMSIPWISRLRRLETARQM